jgi:SAM-dependent methyltransferase
MTSAVTAWNERVRAHNEQTLRVRPADATDEDRWSTLAGNFRADPKRTDDALVNALLAYVTRDSTVIDVGGGGGRYALPLALHCRHVTNVEPSPSMVSVFESSAAEAEITNVSVVQEQWEDAEVEPADLVLCANVLYGVGDIEPFVRKLTDGARGRVAAVVQMVAPMSVMSPLWEPVHGEARIDLPGLPELLPVLWEMGFYPDVQMVPGSPRPAAPSMEVALQIARHFLYVEPGTEKDERLREAAAAVAVEAADGTVTLRGFGGQPQGLVTWRSAGA